MTTTAPRSLTKTAATAAVWALFQSVGTRIASFGSQLVLAWVLLPSAFGEVSMAFTASTVITTLMTFGIDDVLMSRSKRIGLWSPVAFKVSMAFAVLGAVLMLSLAPLAAHFYHNPRVAGLIVVLAISVPINALTTVPNAVLRSHFRNRFLSTYGTAEAIGVQAATVIFALMGLGAYSFVLPLPISAAVRSVVFHRVAPRWARPRRLQMKRLRHVTFTGATVFGQRVIITLRNQADYAVMALLTTTTALGFYFFAFRMAAQPVYALANSLAGALFPGLATLRDQPERQLKAALSAASILTAIALPICSLQAALAGPVLRQLFDKKWEHAIPIVEILSLGLAFDMGPIVSGALANANGRFRIQLWIALGALPAFFLMIVAGVIWNQGVGVAITLSIYYVIAAVVIPYVIFKKYGVKVMEIVSTYLYPALFSMLAIGAPRLLLQWYAPNIGNIGLIVVLPIISVPTYVLLVKYFMPNLTADILSRAKAFRSRKAAIA